MIFCNSLNKVITMLGGEDIKANNQIKAYDLTKIMYQ